MAVKAVPDGFNTVSVYLVVKDAVEALDFYQKAFGAEAGHRMPGPDGKGTMHAEMRIGNSTIMLTDENPKWEMKSPSTLGGSPVSVHLYVEDADKMFKRAVDAGCTAMMPIMDAFWGDRYGKVVDPYGYQWGIATHKEDLSPEETGRRAAEFFANMGDS
jgi:PhnB protein